MAKTEILEPEVWTEVVAWYYGVDLHKDQLTWHCIAKTSSGDLKRSTGKVLSSRILEEFTPLLSKNNCYVIVEASSSSFFFYGLIEKYCTQVLVINPLAFRELYMTGKKTDRIDAKKLADRLLYHVEMKDACDDFPEVTVPDVEVQKMRKLITSYEFIVKQITQTKNQFKAVLRSKLLSPEEDLIDQELSLLQKYPELDNADHLVLSSLKALYETLCREKETMKAAIQSLGVRRFEQEVRLITSFSGISILGSLVFMADIISIDRFRTAKHLTSYLASVGKVDASGGTTRNGGLNRRGRRTSYRFILQGLEHIFRGNEEFQKFRERHKGKRANKVRAAIVRKTFVALFYMLKNKEHYKFAQQALYNRKLRELENILAKAA